MRLVNKSRGLQEEVRLVESQVWRVCYTEGLCGGLPLGSKKMKAD